MEMTKQEPKSEKKELPPSTEKPIEDLWTKFLKLGGWYYGR